MDERNPFRPWFEAGSYDGTWIPVARLGGWLGPAQVAVLFPSGGKEAILASPDWPMQLDALRPYVEETGSLKRSTFHPAHDLGELPLEPLAVSIRPPTRRGWLELTHGFVLHHRSGPRHEPDGRIIWEGPNDDGLPEALARWLPDSVDEQQGVLEVRRDVLLAYLRFFDHDVAFFYEENRSTGAVPDGWEDNGRDDNRTWRVWAVDVGEQVHAVLRCVTVLERPPDGATEWTSEPMLDFVVRLDRGSGKPITARHPPDEFLTPVYFRREVLDRYLADPSHYTVTERDPSAGGAWYLDIATTERGTVQVWLGDLGRLPLSTQRHWQEFATADDGPVPEWRVRQDIFNQFVDPPEDDAIAHVRRAIREVNEAAAARYGIEVFSEVGEGPDLERVKALHIPGNRSAPAFQQQVMALAVLTVEHLNPDFLKVVKAPGGRSR